MEAKVKWLDRIFQNRVLSHFLFWLVLFISATSIAFLNVGALKPVLITNIVILPLQLIAAYFLAYYQIPKFVLKRKYVLFFLSFLSVAYVLAFFARLFIVYIAEPFFREDFVQESFMEILKDPQYLIGVYGPSVYLFPFIFLAIKTMKDRLKERHLIEQLKSEKTTAELNFLKAQIHPHFLFNTLNNLYALTIDKSDAAPDVVIKLSEILDYLLYQCGDDKVSLSQEILLINNYMDLEKIRYGERLNTKFTVEVEDPNIKIAPLILLNLIENAYKHGASNNMDNPEISINLKVNKNKLLFRVFNNKPKMIEKKNRVGLGAQNMYKQLNLIYPNKHQLDIEDKPASYQVNLEIELND